MRVIDVEQALRWAYQDELPKAQIDARGPMGHGVAWDSVSTFGQYLTDIDTEDRRNGYGCVPDTAAGSGPHPDAVRIHEAVLELDDLQVAMPDDWAPIADLGELGPAGVDVVQRGLAKLVSTDGKGTERLRKTPRQLVEFHAMVGGHPDWIGEKPVRRFVSEFGKPKWFRKVTIPTGPDGHPYEIEVDGRDPRRKRPYPDAYRKEYLEPDPAEVVYDRALYQVWHAALQVLVAELRGELQSIALVGPAAPAEPWVSGVQPARILPSVRPVTVESASAMHRPRKHVRASA